MRYCDDCDRAHVEWEVCPAPDLGARSAAYYDIHRCGDRFALPPAQNPVIVVWRTERAHISFALRPTNVESCPACNAGRDFSKAIENMGSHNPAIGWHGFKSVYVIFFTCGGFVEIPLREELAA